MSGLEFVASILSIAAFGTSVATSLHEKADVMIHAHQQVSSMAKHVSQSAAVLRNMAQVLESEKDSCSKRMLRDIRKIRHSCKRTFKEIKLTIQSKRSRYIASVRWIFKKGKARELEARLDSQQSMLQCMMQTLSVVKLSKMDSR